MFTPKENESLVSKGKPSYFEGVDLIAHTNMHNS